ncbi:MAG: phage portal protein [Limimaricola soesokkakensis]|uniref:phage portal protein n=1 Tax=Limimaricola soesokkakensis TaxID=1343159 RepID=UPI004058CD9F
MAFPFSRRRREPAAPAVADPQPAEAEARRASIGDLARQSDAGGMLRIFGFGDDSAGEAVTIDTALQVPAIWCAVGFLSRTLAALPVHVFDKTDQGRQARQGDPIGALLNEAANDETAAFAWRRRLWQDIFTAGRHVSFIERNGRGRVINLWPLDLDKLTLRREAGRTVYLYQDGSNRTLRYAAREVLDLTFMPGTGLSARSPIYQHAPTIGLALAAARYGRRVFANGGVPPFVVTGPFRTAEGVDRAAEDIGKAVRKSTAEGGNAVVLPDGHKIDKLGFDPEQMQMEATQRFCVEQIARIYGLPPQFLQDLTRGTFSNAEQQDLHLVKHTLTQWIALFEGEVNLKLFGRGPRDSYAENALAGILRGDLKSRAEAVARQISTGQITPNEARRMDNRPDQDGGDRLFLQSAMAPIDTLTGPAPAAQPATTTTEGQEE